MECEFSKYGCSTRVANADHLNLHLQVHSHLHLKQVASLLDREVDKNKQLSSAVENLQSRLAQVETSSKAKGAEALEGKLKELETRLQQLQSVLDKTPLAEIKQNGSSVPSIEDIKKPPAEQKTPVKQQLDPRASLSSVNKSTLEKKEEEKKPAPVVPSGRPDSRSDARPDSRSDARPDSRQGQEPKQDAKPEAKVDPRAQSVTPPPFIVKGSTGDIEPQERRHTNMSLREEPRYTTKQPQPPKNGTNLYDRSRAKTWSNSSSRKKEVEPPEAVSIPADAPLETGIIWEYDSVSDEWCRGKVTFRMMKAHFAEGALRTAHMMEIHGDIESAHGYEIPNNVKSGKTLKDDTLPVMGLLGHRYVVKLSKTKVPIDRYFEDVKMQMVCVELAKNFNQQGPPKRVEFLTAWVLEIPKSTGPVWCGLEHYIGGEFKKQSNNHGGVLEPRNTPQAFSHFTWEHTKHNLIVVDLQGVEDDYTDPQIHTKDGVGYGVGNLGKTGIDRFLKTHQCNAICQMLTLPRINSLDTKSAMQKLIKGTQQVPIIDDQLGNLVYPQLDVGADIKAGEFQCTQTLTGHADRVVSLCITSKNLFSGSSDGTLRVWSLPNLTFDRELNVHRKSVESICANDQYLFTASADHSIKVWDLTTFVLVIALRDHVGEVNAIALTDKSLNYLVSASFDKNIKVWSLRTFKCVQTLSGHSKCVKALAISGSILFSGSNDGSVYMWSLKNLTCLFALDAHEGWVKALAIKDKTLYSGAYDFQIKEWKVNSFQSAEVLSDHNDNVNSLCLTDKYLISGSDDKTALVWDLATRKVVAVIKGHRLGVQAVVTDGKFIYTGSDDSSIKVWKWFGDK